MNNRIEEIVKKLNMKYAVYDLKKIKKQYKNAFEINNNLIYFYPLNDGFPTCRFEFYQDNELIVGNKNQYKEITNLDEIILQIVRIFNYSLDEKIVIDPYYFMLELIDEVHKDYHGKANLVITDNAIRNHVLSEDDFVDATKYFINRFLDHFICWNFGVSVNRCEVLKTELEELNKKVIDMGFREYAGTGFEVIGTLDREYDGLRLYELPLDNKDKMMVK